MTAVSPSLMVTSATGARKKGACTTVMLAEAVAEPAVLLAVHVYTPSSSSFTGLMKNTWFSVSRSMRRSRAAGKWSFIALRREISGGGRPSAGHLRRATPPTWEEGGNNLGGKYLITSRRECFSWQNNLHVNWNKNIQKYVGTQKISTQNSKLVVSRRSLYASPEDGDA